ncbi:MAG: hypothetical protein QS748_01465 [Candidatus Endonucleobacter bathymodioli]|uniref:Uncharacterized protein n=1 Tax=Candidatus Endonucleibacter bathymodioli TaxID=539814 RepID=A0AA90NRI1_9GAMM|nr:hypothetical protein [Candidatus Endonucleobacter bathymodioli]
MGENSLQSAIAGVEVCLSYWAMELCLSNLPCQRINIMDAMYRNITKKVINHS